MSSMCARAASWQALHLYTMLVPFIKITLIHVKHDDNGPQPPDKVTKLSWWLNCVPALVETINFFSLTAVRRLMLDAVIPSGVLRCRDVWPLLGAVKALNEFLWICNVVGIDGKVMQHIDECNFDRVIRSLVRHIIILKMEGPLVARCASCICMQRRSINARRIRAEQLVKCIKCLRSLLRPFYSSDAIIVTFITRQPSFYYELEYCLNKTDSQVFIHLQIFISSIMHSFLSLSLCKLFDVSRIV